MVFDNPQYIEISHELARISIWYRDSPDHNKQKPALTSLKGEIRWKLKTCSALNDRMCLFGYGNIEW